jgi:hypothetical protein
VISIVRGDRQTVGLRVQLRGRFAGPLRARYDTDSNFGFVRAECPRVHRARHCQRELRVLLRGVIAGARPGKAAAVRHGFACDCRYGYDRGIVSVPGIFGRTSREPCDPHEATGSAIAHGKSIAVSR